MRAALAVSAERRAEHVRALQASSTRLARQLALRRATRQTNALLLRSMALADGTSKAIASTYRFKADFADNKHARAIQHHGYGGFGGGAHFTMSGSRQFHKGVKLKGIIQRKAGKAKAAQAQATRNKANRGNSSIAVKR